MKVTSRKQAWQEVNKIFPTDYEKDEAASRRARLRQVLRGRGNEQG